MRAPYAAPLVQIEFNKACENGDFESVMRMLYESQVVVDFVGGCIHQTALAAACESGHADCARLLPPSVFQKVLVHWIMAEAILVSGLISDYGLWTAENDPDVLRGDPDFVPASSSKDHVHELVHPALAAALDAKFSESASHRLSFTRGELDVLQLPALRLDHYIRQVNGSYLYYPVHVADQRLPDTAQQRPIQHGQEVSETVLENRMRRQLRNKHLVFPSTSMRSDRGVLHLDKNRHLAPIQPFTQQLLLLLSCA